MPPDRESVSPIPASVLLRFGLSFQALGAPVLRHPSPPTAPTPPTCPEPAPQLCYSAFAALPPCTTIATDFGRYYGTHHPASFSASARSQAAASCKSGTPPDSRPPGVLHTQSSESAANSSASRLGRLGNARP